MDVSTPENCKNLYNQVNDDIDILINNAGFGVFGDFTKTNIDKEIIAKTLYKGIEIAEITAASATGSLLPAERDSARETPIMAKFDLYTH